ncbi:radical SAM protein [Streptomyces sp. NPDC020379]|uniref:radical SAM protein n=1 Tax=Streptomyces sp. NPDC020379 TaxID=3365071 RepID=UPI0037B7493E
MQWKTSRYTYVYAAGERRIAFNSLSLDVYEITARDEELLDRFRAPVSVRDAPVGELKELMEGQLIVPAEADAPGKAVARLNGLRTAQYRKGGGRYRSIRLALTERCNMACSYCFQQQMYPDLQPRMSEEVLEQTLDWFTGQAGGSSVSVQYFGGEPLLEWDRLQQGDASLQQARAEGRVSAYQQIMTTNGTLMTQSRAEWLVSHRFQLAFSFDGPPDINDRLRTYKNGRGTYENAARGLRRWIEAGGTSSLLMTASSTNLHQLPEIVRWFVEESDLNPEVIGLNSPQPTSEGWETGGAELAAVVFDIWNYLDSKGISFHGPGTFIPGTIRSGVPNPDNCVTGEVDDPDGEAWPIYVSADGRRSMCLVHHQDKRVEISTGTDAQKAGLQWHKSQGGVADCDSCPASQLCGGPCTVERILWGGRLNEDRCGFMQEMTRLVLTPA